MTVLVDKLEKELDRNCRLNNWDFAYWMPIPQPPSEVQDV